ncbi:ACT domain-containing protein ACR8-like [Elaeis guineensis]|uniref:ACT domain-containing protein ACR8-like n=1 Tax=Elaeis guineensis var. tenera TaxID=51953 RepID=UPI003C6D0CC4
MEYVVFHGTIDTDGDRAHLAPRWEPNQFESRAAACDPMLANRHRVQSIRGIAIGAAHNGPMRPSRRCDPEIPGDGLSMMRIEVSTKGQMVMNVFYVTDAVGHLADPKMIDVVIEKIGVESLKVNDDRP